MTKEELCRRVAELENVDLFIVDEMKAYTENLNDALKILAKYRGGVVGNYLEFTGVSDRINFKVSGDVGQNKLRVSG